MADVAVKHPTIFSISTLFHSQHGSYMSRLAKEKRIDLTNFIVSNDKRFAQRFSKPDRGLGPYHVDESVAVRQLPLPFERPILQREARNQDYLAAHPEVWGRAPDGIVMSQQCRLNAEIKTLFPGVPPVILYAEYFVPANIAARKEWPLHDSMRNSMQRWEEKSMIDGAYADAIVVPTNFAKSCWPARFHRKIHVVFDGVDVNHLASSRINELSSFGPNLRERFPGKRLVGYIGRTIESIRGFDAWFDVYLRLRQSRSDLHFIVTGEDKIIQRGGGSEFYYGISSFKKHVLDKHGLNEANLPDITWIPRLKLYDYLSLLSVLDVVLYPMYGMFANWSLFQALQMGVPIVASDRAYLPEVIQHGYNGYLADPDEPDSFTKYALKILDSPGLADSLRINAKENIAERYSVDVSVSKIRDLLRKLGIESRGAV